jgi:hypothetical protein
MAMFVLFHNQIQSMRKCRITSTIALVLLLPAFVEAQYTVPAHEFVGKRFVPGVIDFGHPVYEASFDGSGNLAMLLV